MDQFPFEIESQPDDATCGPTCLHAVYRYYGDRMSLESLIADVPTVDSGGTLAVWLACHALARGYSATLYTYNLQLFDPTWFLPGVDLAAKLEAQSTRKDEDHLTASTKGYLDYLRLGGSVRFEDLSAKVIRKFVKRRVPILTGLSATYLYRDMREHGPDGDSDDVRGLPVGHFVVLCGYRQDARRVLVADPLHPNPLSEHHVYEVSIERVIGAILLGIVTYDANLLVLTPGKRIRA